MADDAAPSAKKDRDEASDALATARKRFAYGLEHDEENRRLAVDDMRFRAASPDNGWQWPERLKREREGDPNGARPCLTINKIQQHINQVLNDARQNKPAIKVVPVDDKSDPEVAEIYNGIVRHIENASDADVAYDTALECSTTSGVGYIRVLTEYIDDDSFDQDIVIRRVRNPLTVVDDPDIQRPDGSDRKWCFIVEELSRDEYEDQFGDEHPVDWDLDTRQFGDWIRKDSVRIAEYWCYKTETRTVKRGERSRTVTAKTVMWRKINGAKVLEEREWLGKWIPLARCVGNEYDVEGRLFTSGLTRNQKDSQRMYNYWSSAEVEMLALAPKAPFIGAAGQFEGYEDRWRQANRVNYAYLEYNPVVDSSTGREVPLPAPQRSLPPMPQQAIIQAKLGAADDMKSTSGQYDASLGQRSNETSGVAIANRQRESDIATFHYIDNLSRAIRFVGRIVIDLIPKTYDTRRVARILGEDGSPDFAALDPAQAGPVIERMDSAGKAIGKIYNLGVGRYDVTVAVGPSFTTKRQEAAAAMVETLRAAPQLMQVAGDLIVKAQDWPGADEFAKRLQKTLPPELQESEEGEEPQIPPQVQAQLQQGQQQIEQLNAALEDAMKTLDAMKAAGDEAQAKTANDAEKLRIEGFKAGTERMRAEHEAAKDAAGVEQQLAAAHQRLAAVETDAAIKDALHQVQTLVADYEKTMTALVTNPAQPEPQPTSDSAALLQASQAEMLAQVNAIVAAMLAPRVKTAEIVAPSGQVYRMNSSEGVALNG